ncbi:hypothetical protein [Clostridium butyricum]|uniref:hypothetical protein n=1 Tax=Clostridium butyricum TaxID=1492 RepID=UPI00016BA2DA|nr:hypothetical protein [Clostridium butyricum]MDB2150194.1 hypothetical protein [Clostridium butyricum]NFL32498.1 hypothetical protein [Clostridium butyricum]NFS17209.1 hypothetical protein [Clostridium butyricum]
MRFIDSIDPFMMQLFIVPLIVIGLGILVSYTLKNIFIGPLITLFLNILYEVWYIEHYYHKLELTLTSWNIIFPAISLLISWIVVSIQKQKNI